MLTFVPSSRPHTRILLLRSLALLAGGILVFELSGCAGSKSHLRLGKSGEGEVVEAEGLAPLDSSDLLQSKRASLADAQRNAVEKAVGVFVSARTFVEKLIAIENNILAKTEGYVKKYDILKEGPDGTFYKTKIRALVAVKDIEADLKELSLLDRPELERPRINVDISEFIVKEPSGGHTAALALQKALKDSGYIIVADSEAAKADLLLRGKAVSFPFQNSDLGGFLSFRARLDGQVARPGSKDVLEPFYKEASGLGGSETLAALKSLETVGTVVGEELASTLSDLWSQGRVLIIRVEGVTNFADVEKIRKHLAGQPEIADLVLRSYEENVAQFDVQLKAAKAADLAAHLEVSKSLPMSVIESTPQVLRLKIK